jgi:hypothetical protein
MATRRRQGESGRQYAQARNDNQLGLWLVVGMVVLDGLGKRAHGSAAGGEGPAAALSARLDWGHGQLYTPAGEMIPARVRLGPCAD